MPDVGTQGGSGTNASEPLRAGVAIASLIENTFLQDRYFSENKSA
ncbi:hypothetical protein [Leptolyngbya iicbica]|nr:hypothetical protein [Leptolyngbya sp. LK]